MKATELRIGNLVYDIKDHCNINILTIDFNNTNNFKPIPLTEEYLLKFGFKKWNVKFRNETTYSKGCLILHLRKRGWVINKRFVEPKHVHQLQNLYFALTGEELTIKEDNE